MFFVVLHDSRINFVFVNNESFYTAQSKSQIPHPLNANNIRHEDAGMERDGDGDGDALWL